MLSTRLEQHFDQRVLRCFHPRPHNLNEMLAAAARRQPTAEALVCGDTRLSWRDLDEQVLRAAESLLSR